MKIHLKITGSMLALLSFLFGIGGSVLISASFKESLEREEAVAFGDYRMVWGTLQIVNGLETYLNREVLSRTMEQLYQQNSAFWSNLRLSTAEEVIYEGGSVQTSIFRMRESVEMPASGECLFHILEDGKGGHYLVLVGAIETNGNTLYLSTSHDISELYIARDAQGV